MIAVVRSLTSLLSIHLSKVSLSVECNDPGILGMYKLASQTVRIPIVGTSYNMQPGFFGDKGLVESILTKMMPKKDHLIIY